MALYFALIAADTSSLSLVTTVGAITLSAVGGFVAFAFQLTPDIASRIPQYVWVVLPVIPISIIGHLIHLVGRAIIRGQYLRELEVGLRSDSDLVRPAYVHLTGYVDDPRIGRRSFWLLFLVLGTAGALLIVGAGAAAWYRLHGADSKIVMVGLNGGLGAMLLRPGFMASVFADRLYRQAVADLEDRYAQTSRKPKAS